MSEPFLQGAFVGTGSIAPYYLIAWQRVPDARIVGLCIATAPDGSGGPRCANIAGKTGVHMHDAALDSVLKEDIWPASWIGWFPIPETL